jgi:hypothetical protein
MPYNIMVFREGGKLTASYRAKSYPTVSNGVVYFQRQQGEVTRNIFIHKAATDTIVAEEVSDENALGGGVEVQGVQT